jgi:hypothetical protein
VETRVAGRPIGSEPCLPSCLYSELLYDDTVIGRIWKIVPTSLSSCAREEFLKLHFLRGVRGVTHLQTSTLVHLIDAPIAHIAIPQHPQWKNLGNLSPVF